MTENLIRRGGCRLCLAPDSECVPIFATAAADKEPLSSKIQACVNIKVSFDHFSLIPLSTRNKNSEPLSGIDIKLIKMLENLRRFQFNILNMRTRSNPEKCANVVSHRNC